MAMQRRIPVHTADVFPDGAYLVGPVPRQSSCTKVGC